MRVVCLAMLAGLPGLACRSPQGPASPTAAASPAATGTPQADAPGVMSAALPDGQTFPVSPGQAIRFDHISLEQGLSQSGVFTIMQDRQGFMWFGTEDGLNKYDGYQFTVYKHDPDDPLTLSDSFVSKIYEDRSGELWIGTRSGLDRFDRASGMFVHYQHDRNDPHSLGGTWVEAIYEDSQGTLWVGTEDGGLDLMDRATGTFVHYPHVEDDPESLGSDNVRVIYEDRSGVLWVGTDGGLDRFDRACGTFVHYRHDPNDPHSLSDDNVWAILEDSQGALWVGTESGGLNQMDRSTGTDVADGYVRIRFVHYRHDPGDPGSLSHDRVRAILEDSTGGLWIGTQNGLDQLDRQHDRFIHFRNDPYDPRSLSSNAVWSIYEDQSGVLWFGTYGGGLNKYNRAAERFALYQHNPGEADEADEADEYIRNSLSDNMVWSTYEDRSGTLWIGTFNGGLNRLDRGSGTFTVYRHASDKPSSLSNDDVRAILEDHTGILWVGTSKGLDRFDRNSETFYHYQHNPDNPKSLSDDRVTVLLEDHAGNLWVGTRYGGLNRLERATGTFVRYQHDPEDPFSLSDDRVWALYEDRSGTLWVGTLGGINLLDPARKRSAQYVHEVNNPKSVSNDAAFAFCEDAEGGIWIGTWGSGLDRFNRMAQTFSHYTEEDGLPNNVIYGIEADSAGFLWLSTNRGLSKFDPRTETFRNYDVSNGLQDNEFNVGAHFRSESGEIFFGGIHGFNAFYPEQVSENPHVPPIAITAFNKFNQTVRQDLAAGERIQLSYRDNFISLEFAALDYTAPQKNQYAYMLEGQDQDWVYAGTRRHADYTNLRGGNYVFRVKGSNSDGVWNEEGVAIYLAVAPPIWETGWFRGLVALLLVGSVVAGYRLRVRSVEARSRELESLVGRRTAELQAERNFVTAVLDTAGALVVVLDREGHIVRFNRACERTTGYSFDEVKGHLLWDMLLVPEQVEPVKVIFEELRAGQFPSQVENFWVTRDGQRRLIAWSNTVLLGATGQVEYVIGTGLDVTERRQTEEALSKSEARYRDVVENADSAILQMDRNGNITFFNRFAQEFFGYREEEILGRNVVGTIVPERDVSGTDLRSKLADVVQHPERYYSSENENMRKNGERVWVAWTNKAVYDKDGHLAEILCIGIDRTEQKRAEKALERQMKEKVVIEERSRLARDLHDAVTQTLFSASLIADVLPRIWERNQDEGRRRLEELRQLTRGALAEMRTLLLELRPAALAEAELGDLLRQLAESVTGRARVAVEVQETGACDLPPGVKVALYRIAQEALNNVARHAGASQARVTFACGPQEPVSLRIRDDGRGFDPASVPPEHLGLGIMQERAAAIGARLTIESEVGGGTEVAVEWGATRNAECVKRET